VQRGVAGQLRVERDGEHVAVPDRHRVAVDLGEDLDVVAGVGDPRRADEHRVDVVVEHGQVGLERADLAAERVALRVDVQHPEVPVVEHSATRFRVRSTARPEPMPASVAIVSNAAALYGALLSPVGSSSRSNATAIAVAEVSTGPAGSSKSQGAARVAMVWRNHHSVAHVAARA
jgi:hypothetical protein